MKNDHALSTLESLALFYVIHNILIYVMLLYQTQPPQPHIVTTNLRRSAAIELVVMEIQDSDATVRDEDTSTG